MLKKSRLASWNVSVMIMGDLTASNKMNIYPRLMVASGREAPADLNRKFILIVDPRPFIKRNICE